MCVTRAADYVRPPITLQSNFPSYLAGVVGYEYRSRTNMACIPASALADHVRSPSCLEVRVIFKFHQERVVDMSSRGYSLENSAAHLLHPQGRSRRWITRSKPLTRGHRWKNSRGLTGSGVLKKRRRIYPTPGFVPLESDPRARAALLPSVGPLDTFGDTCHEKCLLLPARQSLVMAVCTKPDYS